MKKTILCIFLEIILLFAIYGLSYADAPSLESINAEIEDEFGLKDYFIETMPGAGDFNHAILEEYRVPVYGTPHGGTKEVSGKLEPRFLGYNEFGESVPNPEYPFDSSTGKPFSKMNWYEKPWHETEVKALERFNNIEQTYFDDDAIRKEFKEHFLTTMQDRYGGTNRFDLNRDKDFPWEDYFHVVLPPTTNTRGVAILFHRDKQGVWYLEVPLAATSDITNFGQVMYDQLIIQHRTLEGAVIGQDEVRTIKNDLTLTAPLFKDAYYRGYGYSVGQPNPALSTADETLTIHYQLNGQPQRHYVTFYYEASPFEVDEDIEADIIISHPIFDVTRAIPTGEKVTIEATVSAPVLFDYRTALITGTETYTVEITQPYSYYWTGVAKTTYCHSPCTDSDGDGVLDTCPGHKGQPAEHTEEAESVTRYQVRRDYSYYRVDALYHYQLEHVAVSNKKLQPLDDVILTLDDSDFIAPILLFKQHDQHLLAPTVEGAIYDEASKTFKLTLPHETYHKSEIPSFDFSAKAEDVVSDIKVRSDYVQLGDQVLLDGNWVDRIARAPQTAPDFDDVTLKKEKFLLQHSLTNGKGETTGQLKYALVESLNLANSLATDPLEGNPVSIHTPVVNTSRLEERPDFDQRVDTAEKPQALPIDLVVPFHIGTAGQHISAPGYGKRDYRQYARFKRMAFAFDVYFTFDAATLNDASRNGWRYLPAGQWQVVPFEEDTVYVRVPHWVDSGIYTVYSQVVALNHQKPLSLEERANLSPENDTAVYRKKVEITERLFDFMITSINDRRWQPYFETYPDAFFTGGSNNKNGVPNLRSKDYGGQWPYQLPIVPGKQTLRGYQDAAIKLGYTFNFTVKTMGSAYQKDDFVRLDFDFYHIDEVGRRSPIDLYYLNDAGDYVQVGSRQDKKVYWAIAAEQPCYWRRAMTLTEIALQTLGDVWYGGESATYLSKVHSKRRIGKAYAVVLDEAFRVYTGKHKKLPAGVDVDRATAGTQMWYGSYTLPSSVIAIRRGENLAAAYREARDVIIKSGYIVVNAKIGRYSADIDPKKPIYSYVTDHSNQWQIEGLDSSYVAGDLAYFHIDQRATDDLRLK